MNLALNPSFESDTEGWRVYVSAGVTLTQDAAQAFSGSYALKVVTPGSLAGEGTESNPRSFNPLPIAGIEAGKTYTISAYMLGNAGGELVRMRTDWHNATGGNLLSPYNVTTGVNDTLSTAWRRVTSTLLAPPGAFRLRVEFSVQGTHAYTWWVDAVKVEEGTVATAFNAPNVRPRAFRDRPYATLASRDRLRE